MRSALLLAGLCAATLNGPPARADAGCPAGINKLRYDDDIACFRDPTDRESPLDALKFVPLRNGRDLPQPRRRNPAALRVHALSRVRRGPAGPGGGLAPAPCAPWRSPIGAACACLRRTLQRARGRPQEWRSEERRVGKGCVSTFRSRWSPEP